MRNIGGKIQRCGIQNITCDFIWIFVVISEGVIMKKK